VDKMKNIYVKYDADNKIIKRGAHENEDRNEESD